MVHVTKTGTRIHGEGEWREVIRLHSDVEDRGTGMVQGHTHSLHRTHMHMGCLTGTVRAHAL
jgi:hypothetical protein